MINDYVVIVIVLSAIIPLEIILVDKSSVKFCQQLCLEIWGTVHQVTTVLYPCLVYHPCRVGQGL